MGIDSTDIFGDHTVGLFYLRGLPKQPWPWPMQRLSTQVVESGEHLQLPDAITQGLSTSLIVSFAMQVSAASQQIDGRTYYVYECLANYGSVGPHTLTSMTTKVCPFVMSMRLNLDV